MTHLILTQGLPNSPAACADKTQGQCEVATTFAQCTNFTFISFNSNRCKIHKASGAVFEAKELKKLSWLLLKAVSKLTRKGGRRLIRDRKRFA